MSHIMIPSLSRHNHNTIYMTIDPTTDTTHRVHTLKIALAKLLCGKKIRISTKYIIHIQAHAPLRSQRKIE